MPANSIPSTVYSIIKGTVSSIINSVVSSNIMALQQITHCKWRGFPGHEHSYCCCRVRSSLKEQAQRLQTLPEICKVQHEHAFDKSSCAESGAQSRSRHRDCRHCLELVKCSMSMPSPRHFAQSRAPSQGAGTEIADIAWNRKVQHILASCTVGGSVTVWDLKKQQPVLNIRDSSGYCT